MVNSRGKDCQTELKGVGSNVLIRLTFDVLVVVSQDSTTGCARDRKREMEGGTAIQKEKEREREGFD